ncbi:MAG: TonB-dependent receptor [Rhodanobacter sp.]|jgi:outer membrane receptor protein involved in Fe transport|nr:TonB-dependent receptor [Rhodanobacter sp.]
MTQKTFANNPFPRTVLAAGLLAILGHVALAATNDDADTRGSANAVSGNTQPVQLATVEVTPLNGADQSLDKIPAAVQTASGDDLRDSHANDLTQFLNRKFTGISFNEMQSNPLQPDVSFRGFTASPLLGTPQGLSVYLDGVRLNQPFGDVVSWDLIPRNAIANITLMPGSNPLFGLNTLGGALSLETKSGRTDPGTTVEMSYGEHARGTADIQTGGSDGAFDWYLNTHYFTDGGWRKLSSSEQGQLFGKLGWHGEDSDLNLSYAHVKDALTGNGLQDQRLLARDYASVYTPDSMNNTSDFLNLEGKHRFSDALSISSNAYYRKIQTHTANGDINEDAISEALYQPTADEQAALAAAGYSGFPTSGEDASNAPFPKWRCIANVLLNAEPNEKCNGLETHTRAVQDNYGIGTQLNWSADVGTSHNNFILGGAYDANRIRYTQDVQFGYLNPDHTMVVIDGPGTYADGTQNSDTAFDSRVNLSSRAHTWSLFFADTLTFAQTWSLTASGRYNRATTTTHDLLNPTGGIDSLNGHEIYSRFNPALGLTWSPTSTLNAYFGYSEGNRAPSAIELGCANEANPCRLPNAMAGDPPLKQVVTRTFEAGLRGTLWETTHWNADVYRAQNKDDILFVAAPDVLGAGYFQNFPKTRREGFDLGFDSRISRVSFGAQYSYVRATYQAYGLFPGDSNSSNNIAAQDPSFRGLGGGTIAVAPGDYMPLIPKHTFKAHLGYELSSAWSFDLDFRASSGTYARGNENNAYRPDGVYYLGPGRSAGYGLFDLGIQYKPQPKLAFFAQIDNLLNRRYTTAAQLGAAAFDANGNFLARPFPIVSNAPGGADYPVPRATFFAPGAPRMITVGVRYTF